MKVYKRESGKEEIRCAVTAIYAECPVPAEFLEIDTEVFGVTHVIATGSPEARPLLLLHGTSSNSASWFGSLSVWSRSFRVYVVDVPGQPGLSDEHRPSFAEGAYVRWLALVVAQLGAERFFLCGQSLGGLIALDYASRYPAQVLALGLLSPSGLVPPRKSFFFKILPFLFMGDRGVRRINRIVSGNIPVDPRFEEFSLLVARYFIQLTEKLPVFDDEKLKQISSPVLYIGGNRDALLPTRAAADRLRKLLPDAEIRVLEGIGHVILDQTEVLEGFFRREGMKAGGISPLSNPPQSGGG